MNDFRIIYKILRALERAMDFDELDTDVFSAESFGVSENRLKSIFLMLAKEGYIDGIQITKNIGGERVILENMKITLKGLEYLHENSFMTKAAKAAKGAVDLLK